MRIGRVFRHSSRLASRPPVSSPSSSLFPQSPTAWIAKLNGKESSLCLRSFLLTNAALFFPCVYCLLLEYSRQPATTGCALDKASTMIINEIQAC
eukprot:1145415-Pelagomonas_calceolata.AAC.6